MFSRKSACLLVAACCLFVCNGQATYAGDRPLVTVYRGDDAGNYVYTTGNSMYTSSLKPNDSVTSVFTISLPDDSTIRFSRLYIYWAWSRIDQKAVYPDFVVTDMRDPDHPLRLSARYADSKGFVSAYDFYSGTDSYELPGLKPGNTTITISVLQQGQEKSSVLVFGTAVLAVYDTATEPRRLIWVNEGCDLMFSSYGISPQMASNEMVFNGTIPERNVASADLFLVAPSAGYSRDLQIDINNLLVNRIEEEKTPPLIQTIFSLLFPNYKGKEWSDIFSYDNTTQIGFEHKEIRPYLRQENNRVIVRDQGDYFQLSNAILAVTLSGEDS